MLGTVNNFVLNGNELIYNFRGGLKTSNGNNLSPLTILVHELDHIWSANSNPEYAELKNISDNKYTNKEEKRVITGIEQVAAKIFGDIKDGETTRENHGGQYFEAYNLKSNRESKKGYNVPLGLRNPSKLNKEKSQKKNEENTDFLRVDYYK